MCKSIIFDKNNRPTEAQFREFYGLIEQSFPACERWSFREQATEFSKPHFRSLCRYGEGLEALINYWELGDFVYVEHFAVSPSLRGKGVGSELLSEVKRLAGERQVVLEAEPAELSEQAKRRLRFYERNGFFVNPYPYIQPAMQENERPIPLAILSSRSVLSEERFIQVRDSIYRTVYNKD